jgi:hypothetical protein
MKDGLGHKLESLVVGPTLVFFSQLIAPFASSRLIAADSQLEGTYLGAAIGFILSVALRPVFIGKSETAKQTAVVVSLVVTLIFLFCCYYIWMRLAPILQPPDVKALQSWQFLLFVAAMGCLCLTVSLASIAYPADYRTAIIIALVIIIVLGIVIGLVWYRYFPH